MLNNNHPHLYKASICFVDVSDVAADVAKGKGEWYKAALANASSGGKFFGVPINYVGGLNAWRVSMFKDIGLTEFPKTWDAYRDAGKKLKAKGFPIGQSLGQSFGDPVGFAYPYLWSMGGAKVGVEEEGNHRGRQVYDRPWKDSMDEGGLAWDNSSNNRAFLASTICATLNGASIYIEALRKPDQYKTADGKPLKDDIQHAFACRSERRVRSPPRPVARHPDLFEEPEGREGSAAVHADQSQLRAVVRDGRACTRRPRPVRRTRSEPRIR